MKEPGYISGVTLHSVDDPTLWLVIGTWVDVEPWKAWETGMERRDAMRKMESLLVAPEKVSVFSFVRRVVLNLLTRSTGKKKRYLIT